MRTMPLLWAAEPISASMARFSPKDPGADGIDLGARRLPVLDQLLEQVVVELGEVLEQRAARLVLAVEVAGGDLDELRGLALAVGPGALGDEIDGAGDLAAVADRDLAEDDGVDGVVLQRGDDVADAGGGLVDAVDEDDRGRPGGFGGVQVGGGEQRRGRVGADADHRGVGGEERVGGDVQELDGAGGVDRLPGLAEMGEARDPELARGGRRVRLALERAHPVDQRGLAGVGSAENRDSARHVSPPWCFSFSISDHRADGPRISSASYATRPTSGLGRGIRHVSARTTEGGRAMAGSGSCSPAGRARRGGTWCRTWSRRATGC